MPRSSCRTRSLMALSALLLAGGLPASAGEAYFTGFGDFTAGNDTLIGTDSWQGVYSGLMLHGVMSEAEHKLAGIGNAAFIGGFATTVTSTSKSVYVHRPVNLDPLALNQEVATFSVVFGIKDSTLSRRDNFEFRIYNQTGVLLGGIQFDNSTLDTSLTPNVPRRLIYRLWWNASLGNYQYVLTDYTFLPETLETLQIRINYRTNRWTATLSDVPIFQDLAFYTGTATKDLGWVRVMMGVVNTQPTTGYLLPGDNYMLFDNYSVRTDAPTTTLVVSKSATGAAQLSWNEEAGYSYQVQYSTDCATWKTDLSGASHTAALTQTHTFTDPTLAVPANRFYRVRRSYP